MCAELLIAGIEIPQITPINTVCMAQQADWEERFDVAPTVEAAEQSDQGGQIASMGIAFWGVGGLSSGLGAVLLLTAPDDDESEPAVAVAVNASGLTLSGRF